MSGLLSSLGPNGAKQLPAGYCSSGALFRNIPAGLNVTAEVRKARAEGNFLTALLKGGNSTSFAQLSLPSLQPYIIALVTPTAAFVAIAILAAIAWPYLCCTRFCYAHRCCAPNPSLGAPLRRRALHTAAYVALGVCTLVAASQGLQYTSGFNVGVSRFGCELLQVFDDTEAFVDEFKSPLADIAGALDKAIADVKAIFDPLESVSAKMDALDADMAAYDSAVNDLGVLTNVTYATPQTTLRTAGTTAKSAISTGRTLAQKLVDLKNNILDLFVTPSQALTSASNAAKSAIERITDALGTYKDFLTGFIANQVVAFQGYIRDVGTSIFVITIATTLLGAVCAALVLGRPTWRRGVPLTNGSFCCVWLLAIIGCVLGGLLLAPAYLMSDVCSVASDFGTAPGGYLRGQSPVIASFVEGCLLVPSKSPLLGLGLDTLDLSDKLGFGILDTINLGANYDFSALTSLVNTANSITANDFGVATLRSTTLARCCTDFGICTDFDTCAYAAGVNGVNASVATALEKVQGAAYTVKATGSALQSLVNTLFEKQTLARRIINPILDAIARLKLTGSCGFLRSRFWGLYDSTCEVLLTSLLWMAIALAGGGVIGICLGSLLLMIGKQLLLSFAKEDAVDEDDYDGVDYDDDDRPAKLVA